MFGGIRRIAIAMPAGFTFLTNDCREDSGGTVLVWKCFFEPTQRNLWIYLDEDATNSLPAGNQTVIVRTVNFGLQNPANSSSSGPYQFPVRMYNWTTPFSRLDTELLDTSTNVGLYYQQTLTLSSPFAYTSSASGAPAPAVFEIPQERYIEEFNMTDKATQYAPIRFDLQIPVALPNKKNSGIGVFHAYNVNYPSGISVPVGDY